MLNISPCHARITVLLVWFLFLPTVPSAAGAMDETSFQGRCISSDEQFEFADQYFQKKEYERAAAEYERFVYFFPDDDRVVSAEYAMGKSYYELGKYDKARKIFTNLVKTRKKSETSLNAYFEISRCCLKMNDLHCAIQSLEHVMTLTDDTDVRDRAWHDMGWIFIENAQWDPAGSSWNRISPDNRSAYAIPALLERLAVAGDIPRKNPGLAGVLAILPGGGYFYCNRYKDALTAFLLNGGLIWAAVSSFQNDNPALGGVITFVEAGFYGGNIYGGINCAHKYNKRQTRNFIEDLKKQHRVRFSMNLDRQTVGMVFEKKF